MSCKETNYIKKEETPIIPLRFHQVKPIPPPPVSKDTEAVIKLLRELLKRAEAGEIHGICVSFAITGQDYDSKCTGCYERFPTDAIGPLAVLQLKLTRQALDDM